MALYTDLDQDQKEKTNKRKLKPEHLPPAAAFGSGGCPYLGESKQLYSDCYYHDYLQLDKILNANAPRSSEYLSEPSHDEHLFITIHQVYELWFKQVLYELDTIIAHLTPDTLDDRELLKIVSRLQRVNKILKLSVEQFTILDTMTPMNFLDFRKYLKPASGFQSVQFRILENKLGLDRHNRMRYNKQEYTQVLSKQHQQLVSNKTKEKQSLFEVLEKWLERFPYLQSHDWSFWNEYKSAVNEYILEEKQLYLNNISKEDKEKYENELDSAYQKHIQTFNVIFNEKQYQELRREGKVRLSYTAMQATLMIMLYREEPQLQMPFRVLELSMDMEAVLTKWRNAHALMVHRMLGSKMGTGGSSGFHYLRTAAMHHKVFSDFFNLSTYMIPKSNLPKLPNSLRFFMQFPSATSDFKRHVPNKQQTSMKEQQLSKDLPPFNTLRAAKSLSPQKFVKTTVTLNDKWYR